MYVPRTRTNYGDRSFSVNGPAVWNSLPVNLLASDISIYIFKHQLKAFLFTTVYWPRVCGLGEFIASQNVLIIIIIIIIRLLPTLADIILTIIRTRFIIISLFIQTVLSFTHRLRSTTAGSDELVVMIDVAGDSECVSYWQNDNSHQ